MANTIEVVGLTAFERTLRGMEAQVFPDAATRAVNRVANTVRSQSGSAIASEMGAKVGSVKSRIQVRKAKRGQLPEASITHRGRPLNLVEFKARETKKGVSAAPWSSRRIFVGAFIADMRGGNRLVMIRRRHGNTRVGRLPLDPMFGPGVAQTANEEKMRGVRVAIVEERMPIELESQIAYLVGRMRR